MTFRRWSMFAWLVSLAAPMVAFGQDDTLEWQNNYQDALQEAKQTKKPIFLEYRCEP